MRNRVIRLVIALAAVCVLASSAVLAQSGQSAGAAIVYAAGEPITNGQGILVQSNSPIRTDSIPIGFRVKRKRACRRMPTCRLARGTASARFIRFARP